ncbi:MAG: branched-chain amino acid transaminase [Candidatus Nitrosothermus koennekii]|nr:MAG: branched-chain amino acid transaminase [Candidatus Nitrosothermus koennekii]
MEFNNFRYVWFDGNIIEWEDAKVPLMTHALHYGTSVIEGIRAYASNDNLYVFRLKEHMSRLLNSAKVYSMNIKYSLDEMVDAVIDIIKKNEVRRSCYIRPIGFIGFHGIDLNVTRDSPAHLAIMVFRFEQYLNSSGIRVCISSWRRISDPSVPPLAKAGGNYLNSVLATQECKRNGYDEAIMLDSNGNVSEAPGENIFIVRDKKIYTPALSSGVLEGITRDTAITIAKDLGYEVIERSIPRTELYISDEIFVTGTAAEITPVISVDNNIIGDGKEGEVTKSIRETYSKTVRGEVSKYMHWLTPVW